MAAISLLVGVGVVLCRVVRAAPVQLARKSSKPTSMRVSNLDENLDTLSVVKRSWRVPPIASSSCGDERLHRYSSIYASSIITRRVKCLLLMFPKNNRDGRCNRPCNKSRGGRDGIVSLRTGL